MSGEAALKTDNLAIAVHSNSEGAIEQLVRLYQEALCRYALRLLQDRFAAEEVTQDAFVRAIRALTSQYDVEKCRELDLKPWLYHITRNLAYSRRKLRRFSAEVPLPEPGDAAASVFRSEPNASKALETQERQARMELALSRLKTEARDLVLLRFMEELSYAEIAAVVNTSESSVRGKVFRALQTLRKVLEKMGDRYAM